EVVRPPTRHCTAEDETTIGKVVGKDRQPVERAEVGVAGIDDLDYRMERRNGGYFGAIIRRGARRQIAVNAKGGRGFDADDPQFRMAKGGRARTDHASTNRGAEGGGGR